ncbi:nuclear transport factor 2 family protein [Herbiconiux sp. P15]|uniref:nuclear transport factor 2 family protein n=1 Tax=Herbiconiux liukaitaii TaxID=3342799 RepID=UPI0035B87C7E
MASESFSADRLHDRLEIQHRVNQFCRAIDRLDLEELREVYHADGYDDHGAYQGDVDGFIEWVRGRHEQIAFSSHHITNTLIEFVSDDSAFVETYFLAWQSVNPNAMPPSGAASGGDQSAVEAISSGRYADHFVRKDGRWAIQTRTAIPGSLVAMTEGLHPGSMPPGAPQGSRDENDPAERLRVRLGLGRP